MQFAIITPFGDLKIHLQDLIIISPLAPSNFFIEFFFFMRLGTWRTFGMVFSLPFDNKMDTFICP